MKKFTYKKAKQAKAWGILKPDGTWVHRFARTKEIAWERAYPGYSPIAMTVKGYRCVRVLICPVLP